MSMRLFMTADSVGGVWSYALQLARALQPHGVQMTIAVLGSAASSQQLAQAQGIEGLDVLQTDLPLDWQAEDGASVADTATHIATLARRHAANIVQLNSPILAAFEKFSVPVVGVCHSCVATWWDATCGGSLPADFEWRTSLLLNGYRACDIVVAPTAAYGNMVASRYGISPTIIANGIDEPRNQPNVQKERFVLTAGRLWDKGKNFATLDAAAALLDAPVYAAGALIHPPSNEVACNAAISLGFLSTSSLQSWMQRAAIFVSVAVYEPFGLAVLEAAQNGCALVLADTPGFRELWHDAAVFVSPRDAKALASNLQEFLDAPSEARRFGQAARQRARQFDLQRLGQGMMALYRRLDDRHGLAAA
jgi:glycogen(starch) synthase